MFLGVWWTIKDNQARLNDPEAIFHSENSKDSFSPSSLFSSPIAPAARSVRGRWTKRHPGGTISNFAATSRGVNQVSVTANKSALREAIQLRRAADLGLLDLTLAKHKLNFESFVEHALNGSPFHNDNVVLIAGAQGVTLNI